MKKQKLLVYVNSIMFLAFVTTIVSITIYKLIPNPLNGDELVAQVHGSAGLIFFILALVHITLNWNWIKAKMFNKKGEKK